MIQELDDLEEETSELYEHYKVTVDNGQQFLRIDKFLVDRIPKLSRHKIQLASKAGLIKVNGIEVKSNYKVKPKDEIVFYFISPKRELELIPENIPISVTYEDEHLIIVDKAPGMVVHPGYGNYRGTLINALLYHFNELQKLEGIRPGLVHRIDKDTSGLLVVAKTEESMAYLAKQFFNHTIDRSYLALIWGEPKETKGTIMGNIARSTKDRKIMQVYQDPDIGKHAVTHYEIIEKFGYVTLVKCTLETGRTHQIRVHFQSIGHPLFNDPTYGGNKILKGSSFSKYKQFIENCFTLLPRQALHAHSLGFIHPITQKKLLFTSELPTDFNTVLEKWRRYVGVENPEIS